MKPRKHQRSKQRCQDLCWKVHDHAQSFVLYSYTVWSKQLLSFVHGWGKKSEQKHTTMNFVEFHTHTPLLTMTTAAYFMRTSYCSGSLFFLHFLGPHSTRNWNFVNLLTSVYDSLLVFLFRKLLVHLNNKSASEREANREARRPQSAFHKWCIFIIALTFHFSSNFTAFWKKCKIITFVYWCYFITINTSKFLSSEQGGIGGFQSDFEWQ